MSQVLGKNTLDTVHFANDGAAACEEKLGRRPLRVSAAKVNCDTTQDTALNIAHVEIHFVSASAKIR